MSTTPTATQCPTSSIPENLPIPQNITYAVIPGHNTSDQWMNTCCQPNPVRLADNCWEWCEVPETYAQNDSDADVIMQSFMRCLRANGRNLTTSNAIQVRIPSAAPHRPIVPVVAMTLAVLAACKAALVFGI